MILQKEKYLATLYVGIDISKENIDICQMQEDGKVVKFIQFPTDSNGFNQLIASIPKSEKPLFVIEKTGPYSGNLEYFLKKSGHNCIICNPFEVSRLREVFSYKIKNDTIDSWVLAQAARMNVLKHSSRSSEYIYLRDILERVYDLKDRKDALINQLHACIVESFPELFKIFTRFDSNAFLGILTQYQSPEQIINANIDDIKVIVKQNNGRIAEAKINKLKEISAKSVAWKNDRTYLQVVKSIVREIQYVKKEIKIVMNLVDEYIDSTFPRELNLLTSIPGIGSMIACHILSIMGNHKRFDLNNDGKGSRRVSSFVGYGVIEYSSGKRSKRFGLTKRGDSKLRGLLYMAALTAIRVDPDLANKFKMKKERSTSKNALVSLSHLLLRRSYGVLKSGKIYNPDIPKAGQPLSIIENGKKMQKIGV